MRQEKLKPAICDDFLHSYEIVKLVIECKVMFKVFAYGSTHHLKWPILHSLLKAWQGRRFPCHKTGKNHKVSQNYTNSHILLHQVAGPSRDECKQTGMSPNEWGWAQMTVDTHTSEAHLWTNTHAQMHSGTYMHQHCTNNWVQTQIIMHRHSHTSKNRKGRSMWGWGNKQR